MGRMATRRLEVEVRISGFGMETEFYFTIFQGGCSIQKYIFGTRYVQAQKANKLRRVLGGYQHLPSSEYI